MASKRRILERVQAHLSSDEDIRAVATGRFEVRALGRKISRNGVLVGTDQRLVFFAKKLRGVDWEEFSYDALTAVEQRKDLPAHPVSFSFSDRTVTVGQSDDSGVDDLVRVMQEKLGEEDARRVLDVRAAYPGATDPRVGAFGRAKLRAFASIVPTLIGVGTIALLVYLFFATRPPSDPSATPPQATPRSQKATPPSNANTQGARKVKKADSAVSTRRPEDRNRTRRARSSRERQPTEQARPPETRQPTERARSSETRQPTERARPSEIRPESPEASPPEVRRRARKPSPRETQRADRRPTTPPVSSGPPDTELRYEVKSLGGLEYDEVVSLPESTRRKIFFDVVDYQDRTGDNFGAFAEIAHRHGLPEEAVRAIGSEGVLKSALKKWSMPSPYD
jgi:hypothetical protein